MSPHLRTRAGRRPAARWAVAAVTASTVAVAGLGAATPAQSAPTDDCPAAFPVDQIAPDQPVTGKTVTRGTTPVGFTGETLGVLEDGIAPGIDMVLVRLTSTEIDRVGGIWSGMSGSPVYADDGRLIGAVSYGLATGPSPVAGVTPTAAMQAMLTGDAQTVARKRVTLPARMADALVRSGDATAAEADSGLAQLRLPFGIAGLNQKRFATMSKKLGLTEMRTMRVGTTAGSGATAGDIVPGGNMAASIAYGDVTAAAVGTATAICDGKILGFGHPMLWTGPATLTLHPANAIYVQEDPTVPGFKLANIGAPVGTVSQDRMPGIVGTLGATPRTTDVTSTVASGTRTRENRTTRISVGDYVPDMGVSHLLANEDAVFDGIGRGSATVGWTIRGTRPDGRTFSLTRRDQFADKGDITFATAVDFYMALGTLQFNGVEDVRVDRVNINANLSRTYDRFVIKRVDARVGARWVKVDPQRPLMVRAGKTQRLRVQVSSPVIGIRYVVQDISVPPRSLGKMGMLSVYGGNTGAFSDEENYFYEEGPSVPEEPTFDQILSSLRREPRNNQVVADLVFVNDRGRVTNQRHSRVTTTRVVDGSIAVPVIAVP